MRIQKARNEPVHIALEKLDQPVIRIEQAPFLAAEQLGWRKFLSPLYGEIFLQENDLGSRRGHSRWPQNLFCPKLSLETMDSQSSALFRRTKRLGEQIKSFDAAAANSLQLDITKSNHLFSRSHVPIL